MKSGITLLTAMSLAVGLGACGDDDPFNPTVQAVAGTYTATAFTLTTPVADADLLATGATMTITLAEDGTTTGRLFVPSGLEGAGDLDADLAGTWTLAGSTVTFDQTADTFVRDVEFTAERDRLVGEETFSGGTIRLVLGKDD